MERETFNLTTEPWIKVIELKTNQEKKVSLIDIFQNAQNYRQLAGDMRAQDLVILRLLLAILTTVYSRFDANGTAYDWLEIDEQTMQVSGKADEDDYSEDGVDDLFGTWSELNRAGKFSEVVVKYLKHYQSQFDLFGDYPFYQVTEAEYNTFVAKEKQVSITKPKGIVGIKQINRRISESGNSVSIFSPKIGTNKDELTVDELARWLITYQNFTGVTDKTKIIADEKFSDPLGWLYSLDPVFAFGNTLFETLMLNLVLVDYEANGDEKYLNQRPVWEFASINQYVDKRKKQLQPDNIAELYTTWSRLLHIEWDEAGKPIIFSAAIPIFTAEDAFIEPMTTWRFDKKANHYRPATRGLWSLDRAMWRNFGNYVRTSQSEADNQPEAGVVNWLRKLLVKKEIPNDEQIILASATMIHDDNASSRLPAAEIYDEMRVNADVIFDESEKNNWPARIEEAINVTQKVGDDYRRFISTIAQIRNRKQPDEISKATGQFYDQLNEPFNNWLASLNGDDDRDERIIEWKRRLKRIVLAAANEVMRSSSPRDIIGNYGDKPVNIFTVRNQLMHFVNLHLDLPQKGV